MNADEWTICPKCRRVAAEENRVAEHHLDDIYGKVPREEWEDMQRSVTVLVSTELIETLYENFTIGIQGSDFRFEYKARCAACDFSYSREGLEPALGDEE